MDEHSDVVRRIPCTIFGSFHTWWDVSIYFEKITTLSTAWLYDSWVQEEHIPESSPQSDILTHSANYIWDFCLHTAEHLVAYDGSNLLVSDSHDNYEAARQGAAMTYADSMYTAKFMTSYIWTRPTFADYCLALERVSRDLALAGQQILHHEPHLVR